MAGHILIVEPDPESDEILIFSVVTKCKRLVVRVGNREVIVERSKDKLVVRKDGAYTAKRVTLRHPKERSYLFYKRTADGTVEIEAEALY